MSLEDEAKARAEFLLNEAREWGTYVANTAIDIGTGRAFNPGDPVPASHVERGVVPAESVDKVDNPPKVTKAAVAAVAAEQNGAV